MQQKLQWETPNISYYKRGTGEEARGGGTEPLDSLYDKVHSASGSYSRSTH